MKKVSAYYFGITLLSWQKPLFAFSPHPSLRVRRRAHHKADIKHQTTIEHNVVQIFSNYNAYSRHSAHHLTALSSTNSNGESQPSVKGVTLKMAFDSSPVWGVAETSPTSERFTSPESLDMVHRLRRESCAVLVGRGTVERDDCSLTVRRVEMRGEQPVRVVLDPGLKLLDGGGEYTLLNDGLRTIIYHSVADYDRQDSLSDDVTLVQLKQRCVLEGPEGTHQYALSPADIIQDLSKRGLNHIMVEGGPATALEFLNAKLIDRAILVRAPVQFKAPIPAKFNEETFEQAGLVMIGTENMGGDSIEYWVRMGMDWPNDELSLWP